MEAVLGPPLSDRNAKTAFETVDARGVLETLAGIPIETWIYKTEEGAARHMGPVSQDFYAAFELGGDDTRISTVDSDGVALAAIQGLYEIVNEQQAQIADLESQLAGADGSSGVGLSLPTDRQSMLMWLALAGLLGVVVLTNVRKLRGGVRA